MKDCHVLVITPHPDDAEFGIAGTVIKWVRENKEVVYVVCTNGNKGSSDPDMTPEKLAGIRESEQLAAAELLGVREVVFLRYDDQSLEDTPEFRKELVRQIRTFRPEIVVTSDPYKKYLWHRDHRITGRVVLDAVFPYARDRLAYPDLLEEGLQPHKVEQVLLWASDNPNYFSDISDTFDKKMAALRCHHSQIDNLPPEFEERMKKHYREFATGTGYLYVEALYRVDTMW
ncbi:MAG: PIG-L family deacetylase [Dehalococcoidia bacterium]